MERNVMSPRPATVWSALAACALVASFAGCADETVDRTHVYPVRGTILVDGMPAVGAKIALHRLDKTDAQNLYPRATVDKDGTFRVSTYIREDGAPSGQYVMTVRWPDPEVVARDPYGESAKPPPDLLEGRFATPQRSNLRVAVPKKPIQLAPIDLADKEVREAGEYRLVAETDGND